ncbi:sensor histidine kinase [Ferruginibacter sp.]|nr:histidine kinase [Ferruginibacter sp.]
MHNAAFLIKYKLHHLFFWMMLFAVWYFLRYEDYSTQGRAFTVTLIKVADLALMIYITNYLLIPQLLYKKRYILFALAFIALIITSSIFKMYIIGKVINSPALLSFSGNIKARIYDNVIPHFFLVLSGAAFKLMLDYTRMQQHMVEMAKEKAEAELNFLKLQINPHFLFNSLNSVYFLIEKNNTGAREALHKFSEMLRYQLYEMNGATIPIEKEIRYLKDYVDLQKLRKDENYEVRFTCNPGVNGFSIEPLLLIPFVENAFKHISHQKNERNFIAIDLSMINDTFHFAVENSKEAIEKNTGERTGIGLANVKRRLELLYPQKYELHIKNESGLYRVDLKIKM